MARQRFCVRWSGAGQSLNGVHKGKWAWNAPRRTMTVLSDPRRPRPRAAWIREVREAHGSSGGYNHGMDTALLDQIVEPFAECLTPGAARKFVDLRAEPAVPSRTDELAEKANRGTLSEAEKGDYDTLLAAFHWVTILQARAWRVTMDAAHALSAALAAPGSAGTGRVRNLPGRSGILRNRERGDVFLTASRCGKGYVCLFRSRTALGAIRCISWFRR
jgi:hypothetical protein